MTDQARDARDDPHPDGASERVAPAGGDSDDTEDDERDPDRAHLEDVDDGAGCAEIWERIAEHRERTDETERPGAADEADRDRPQGADDG